jgi:hypothetical protein
MHNTPSGEDLCHLGQLFWKVPCFLMGMTG